MFTGLGVLSRHQAHVKDCQGLLSSPRTHARSDKPLAQEHAMAPSCVSRVCGEGRGKGGPRPGARPHLHTPGLAHGTRQGVSQHQGCRTADAPGSPDTKKTGGAEQGTLLGRGNVPVTCQTRGSRAQTRSQTMREEGGKTGVGLIANRRTSATPSRTPGPRVSRHRVKTGGSSSETVTLDPGLALRPAPAGQRR